MADAQTTCSCKRTTCFLLALVLGLGVALPVGVAAWFHVARNWRICSETTFWKKQGNAAFQVKDFTSASRLYARGLSADASNMELSRLAVRARLNDSAWRLDAFQGDFPSDLLLDADSVDRNFPSDKATTLALRGYSEAAAGRLSQAQEIFKKALAIDPANGPTHLAKALLDRVDPLTLPDAVTEMDQVLKARPDSAELLALSAQILLDGGDPKEASARYEKALALKVRPEWLRDLGAALLAVKDIEGATRRLVQSSQLNSRDANTWGLLTQAYLMSGNYVGAESAARTSLGIQAQPVTSLRLAQALNAQKKFSEAVQVLIPQVQKQRDILLVAELAGALEGVGRKGEAAALYREIAELKAPDDPRQSQMLTQLQQVATQHLQALEAEAAAAPAPAKKAAPKSR